jgi:hypothetical protein
MDTGRSHVVSLSGTSRGYRALVTAAQRAQPGRGWLTEAAARIGSTPDLITTAREVTGLSRLVLDFLDHRHVYFDPANLVPGMPGMRVRKEVNVETITVAGGSRCGPRP